MSRSADERTVEVDEGLESLVVAVESAVVTYLVRITEATRQGLLDALEALDADAAASESFHRRLNSLATLTGLAGLGTSSLDVIGQKSGLPTVTELPLPLFQAQVALVRAAKDELREPSPATLHALESASAQLAATRRSYLS